MRECKSYLMMSTEVKMDYRLDRRDLIEEGFEQGKQEGIEQGRQEGIEQGRKEGIEQGRKEGIEQGRQRKKENR